MTTQPPDNPKRGEASAREWWITFGTHLTLVDNAPPRADSEIAPIHVIEMGAYDEAISHWSAQAAKHRAEADALKSRLDELTAEFAKYRHEEGAQTMKIAKERDAAITMRDEYLSRLQEKCDDILSLIEEKKALKADIERLTSGDGHGEKQAMREMIAVLKAELEVSRETWSREISESTERNGALTAENAWLKEHLKEWMNEVLKEFE